MLNTTLDGIELKEQLDKHKQLTIENVHKVLEKRDIEYSDEYMRASLSNFKDDFNIYYQTDFEYLSFDDDENEHKIIFSTKPVPNIFLNNKNVELRKIIEDNACDQESCFIAVMDWMKTNPRFIKGYYHHRRDLNLEFAIRNEIVAELINLVISNDTFVS